MLLQMEKQDAFDKLLYYRVCCVREEVRDFFESLNARDVEETTIEAAYPHALPAKELALIKELLQVKDQAKIAALIKKNFETSDQQVPLQDQAVLPHKLLECLSALIRESVLEENERMAGEKRPSTEVVKQMRRMRRQAVSALYDFGKMH